MTTLQRTRIRATPAAAVDTGGHEDYEIEHRELPLRTYSDFNPGTYQSAISAFNPAVTVNLTVGPVPEPSALALLAVGGLNGLLLFRRPK
jgi:hypothetical protein